MHTLINILITLLVFGFLILTHELGHFLVAKWAKVKINEFSIGMGPKIFSKQGKETLYSLRALPIGGYVAMEGEDGDSDDGNAFCKKSKFKRFLILVTGALMNILFGFILICIIFSFRDAYPTTYVAEFDDNSVSSSYGLKEKDKIIKVDNYKIYSYMDLSYAFTKNGTTPVDITVVRDGKKVILNDVKFPVENDKTVGDYFSPDFIVYGENKTPVSLVKYSFNTTISISRSIYSFFGSLFTGNANLKQVSGPVGTTKVIGESASFGILSLLLIVAMISINLGIVNLLPFPALDGGRIFLLLIEAIIRRPLNKKFEMIFNSVGMILLMLLMVIITAKDILNLF